MSRRGGLEGVVGKGVKLEERQIDYFKILQCSGFGFNQLYWWFPRTSFGLSNVWKVACSFRSLLSQQLK